MKVPLPSTFWMTRDRVGGDLKDDVEVWASRPLRRKYEDGDVMWLPVRPPDMDEGKGVIDTWSLAEAKLLYPGTPDTDMECTRVGNAT